MTLLTKQFRGIPQIFLKNSGKFQETCRLEDNVVILNKFIKYGIKKITFTGGEATLYDGLWELIKRAKQANVYTNLIANLVKIDSRFFKNIEKHINCLTMSLDGPDTDIQNKMTRNTNHFDNVLNTLDKIEHDQIKIDKKVNTLVAKDNIDYIIKILPILYKFSVNVWKLFQFIPFRFMAKQNRDLFSISENEFTKLKNNIIIENNHRIKTIFQSTDDLKRSYFVVSSNGNVRSDAGTAEKTIGNLLEEDIEVIINKMYFGYSQYEYRKNTYSENLAVV
jgi:MoaA/NifB/PqqE/SkfB family radical SAM enzyme